jgi:hypothetical protein
MSTSTQSRVTRLFHKVLVRHADCVHCPEGQLMASIITRAFQDALHGSRDARRFFVDGRMDWFASLIGADANTVRDMAHRGHGYRARRVSLAQAA